ncbi:Long-chain-fatty-acid--CoA ligase FadD15 [Candidatus Entotheonellaceae bacterium PAL068K]
MAPITQESDTFPDTFPKLLIDRARRHPTKIAMREKDLGLWQEWSWVRLLDEVRALACGLADLGCRRGDKIAIIGDNRPRLYLAIVAVQCLGGVPVPLYQDAVAEEMQFVLDHAETRFAVVEDQEQVDKLLAVRERCPHLECMIYEEARGLRHYSQPFLLAFDAVLEQGRQFDVNHPDFFSQQVAKGQGTDLSIILYTSGTTGRPKGVMLSYDNIIHTSRHAVAREGLRDDEETLAYLPMAWVGDHILSYGQFYCAGFTVNCPESSDTVLHDLHEIGPTYFFAPPRIWENILTAVMIRIEDAAWIKRKMFHFFMQVAQRVGARKLSGQSVSLFDTLLYGLGDVLVYGPLKDNLGFSRIRLAYTAGEAIGPEIFTFYRSLGVNIKQLYGMTEASVFVCVQPNGEVKPDTVGTTMPEVELKITEEGEVMFRSPGIFLGYYKNPEATAETLADGWMHSGDAGYLDDQRHLKIIDRARDVSRLDDANRTLFAPRYLENKLKFSPYIKEAVVHGQKRSFVGAFINIDLEAVGNWADRRGLTYTSYTDLAARSDVYDLIQAELERVNASLAAEPQLAGAQIRRFLILHKELDPDDGELTRTRKVRRRFIGQKYADLIAALYSDDNHIAIEAQVVFEDGRSGTINADLQIRDVTPVPSEVLTGIN